MATNVETDWKPAPEWAPSMMRADEPRIARLLGMVGLFFVLIGMFALVLNLGRSQSLLTHYITPGRDIVLVLLGLGGLLFHAASDHDVQVRRMYMMFGVTWLAFGVAVSLFKITFLTTSEGVKQALSFLTSGPADIKAPVHYLFLPYGVIGLTLGVLFLMAFLRQETEANWRQWTERILGGLGLAAGAGGFLFSNLSFPGSDGVISPLTFLLPYGLVVILLGLLFSWAFVGARGTADHIGYRAAQLVGAIGLVGFLVALGRSLFDPSYHLMPGGLLLMGCGLIYMLLSIGMWSDLSLVVLTRRELAAIFFSPIAYIVLFGFIVVAWQIFLNFAYGSLWSEGFAGAGPVPMTEPIVSRYFVAWFPVIFLIFLVPVLTMRLLSEENRTGTIEVLLTGPVGEATVVLSKFLAAFLFFMFAWLPLALNLIALRVEGGQPFDYRPIVSFFIALAFSGAGFLSMGLFFSSLTRNQVAAAILTFVGMLVLVFIYFSVARMKTGDPWQTVLQHISFIHLWDNALKGRLAVRDLLYHVSAAVFWLFLTVKVLESRKWR